MEKNDRKKPWFHFTSFSWRGTSETKRFFEGGVFLPSWQEMAATGIVFIVVTVAILLFFPMWQFPAGEIITIKPETTTHEIGVLLSEKKVIYSAKGFTALSNLFVAPGAFQSGKYLFDRPISVVGVITRLVRGEFGVPQKSIRVLPGMSVYEIADLFAKELPGFDRDFFITLASPYEGYLFPGNYYLFEGTTPQEALQLLRSKFQTAYATLAEKYTPEYSERDIVIMASILQREAYDTADARVISGILWKRLSKGMALQVDATVAYGLDKPGGKLTTKDLGIDTPYNTYTNKGLPVGPIGNPGNKMLRAAMDPEESPYLFYLHAHGRQVYYARTGTEHVANQKKYLR